jgi:hypothetical protein
VTISRTPLYRNNGRLRGTYVYLVLCQEQKSIFVKIGVADEPIKRLRGLATGCPLDPEILAYVELPSRPVAFQVERGLHRELLPWRIRGEWFKFDPRDRAAFNERLREVLVPWNKPSQPMKWTKLNAGELLRKITAAHLRSEAAKDRRAIRKTKSLAVALELES